MVDLLCWYTHAQILIAKWRKYLYSHTLLQVYYQSDMNTDILLLGPSNILLYDHHCRNLYINIT